MTTETKINRAREMLSGILEGFEDGDGVIRDVRTADILTCAMRDVPLFDAAPELLEALCQVVDSLNWHANTMRNGVGMDQHRLEVARAAIAKAKGTTP